MSQTFPNEIPHKVSTYIKLSVATPEINTQNKPFSVEEILYAVYQTQGFQSIWLTRQGELNGRAKELLQYLQQCPYPQKILTESFYGKLGQLQTSGENNVPASVYGEVELALSKAFIQQAQYNLKGYVTPESMENSEWYISARYAEIDQLFINHLKATAHFQETLDSLLPQHQVYRQLLTYKRNYEEIALHGGWPSVPDSILNIEVGDTSSIVQSLKQRLSVTNDLHDQHLPGDIYDSIVEIAVKKFQNRHGLKTDGVVGKNTLYNLNIPVEDRLRQIEINLDRFKWLPNQQQVNSQYIWVNIPEYNLRYYRNDQVVRQHKVVVGAKKHRTPMLTRNISNLVFNPYWNVPYSIAKNEISPQARKDAEYLSKKNYELVGGWGTNDELDLTSDIDWNNGIDYTKVRIRQKPGPGNALGMVKFNMPNPWNIYLHDTPSKSKFYYAHRAFSHGCIRVENPIALATDILENQDVLAKEEINKLIKSHETKSIRLNQQIPVYLVYMTAWVDEQGNLMLYEDIYGKDHMYHEALNKV
ncbi:L,D-transpeptidase family protein [Rapidithrix thailandica]|uniref:L,D-transpeptidase family protein n=1 Tax=Rapidithrix thailandica TaxID=413964 RepID=A0AAW9S705_9BACT